MASEQQRPRTSTDSNPASNVAATSNGEARNSTDEAAAGGASSQTSAFQAAISAWRSIDLTHLQKSLDATAGDIVNGQRESLVERKELAQKTKEYRKLDDEQKKEEWKGLLKSYQIFIDHLTTSKKATETSFLALYSTLAEAPDPYPLLEATIDSLVNFSDVQAMTKDNASLKATVNRLSNQITNLEASLAAKNKELERKEKEKGEESQRVEKVWKGVLDEKTRNWEGKEKALTEKLEHQETVLKEIKASFEVAQRMGPTNLGTEDGLLGKERSAELEIVNRDLERTTLRLAEAEGRNEQLRLELAKASSQGNSGPAQAVAEDDSTILRLQHESANLLRKVNNAKSDLEAQKKEAERKVRTLERTIDGLEKDKDILREKVSKWSDYEDVKRELEILKSIEFSTGDEDDDVLDFSAPAETSPHDNKKETLEQLLLARNKKLGNELTVLRVSHQDLTSRLQTLQQTLDAITADFSTSRALNQKLENDLLKLQDSHHQPSSALSVAGTYVSRYPQSSIARGSRPSPTSSIIGSQFDSLRTANDSTPTPNAGILPMITAQRDRFKTKNVELEHALAQAHTNIANLRDEVANLRKDNLQLYEKTRYVSSYARAPPTNTATATSGFAPNGGSGASIDRYRQAYEARISPFEAFRGRESARAYHRMRVPERVIYSFTRVILANRVSRNLFAAYCLLLHVLIVSMLYWAGIGETTGAATAGLGVGAVGMAAAAPGGKEWTQEGFDGRL
ncbi:CASP C terminal-domain-containing protein [Tricharina praecox]|uniref:CASP C terminal-domain-containing protein n=1 Tax=Tricharina praecox TaxID=43433 RepID=UPI0022211D8D|nr:CASP C terminal-domain-containing protein [Tricharina praecox]KAI5856953.1 CASP C terminal-domain-containing protein [Tricharina praecox]